MRQGDFWVGSDARDQGAHIVGRLERGECDRRLDQLAITTTGEHALSQRTCNPPGHDMSAATIRFRESRQDGSVLLPVGKIDLPPESAKEACSIVHTAALVLTLEGYAGHR